MEGLWCHECGRSDPNDCPEHGPLHAVPDSVVLPIAQLTLPKGLVIRPNLRAHPQRVAERGVFAKRVFPARSKFGPVIAPFLPSDATYSPIQSSSLILKVFHSDKDAVTLDMTDETQCNWMMYVRSACSSDNRQNLVSFQCEDKIYFVATRMIHIGDELRVGYAANYTLMMLANSTSAISDCILSDMNAGSGVSEDSSVESHTVLHDNSYDEGMDTVSTESDVKVDISLLPSREIFLRGVDRTRSKKNSIRNSGFKGYVSKLSKENISLGNGFQGGCSKDSKNVTIDCTDIQPGCTDLLSLEDDAKRLSSTKMPLSAVSLATSGMDDVCPRTDLISLAATATATSSDTSTTTTTSLKRRDRRMNNNIRNSSSFSRVCAIEKKLLHKCDFRGCGKVFVSRFLLDRHMVVHSAPRNHKCFFCEKSFHRRDHLTAHLNTHKPDKPTWVCKHCGKQYISRFMHRTHMAMHAAEKGKINNCPICNKKYNNKEDLLLHLKIHGGMIYPKGHEKIHKCVECGKAFNKRKDMKRHIVMHTRKREYRCTFCPRLFRLQDQLHRHFRKFHSHAADCGQLCSGAGSAAATAADNNSLISDEDCENLSLTNVLRCSPTNASGIANNNNNSADSGASGPYPSPSNNREMPPIPQSALSKLSIHDKDYTIRGQGLIFGPSQGSLTALLYKKNMFDQQSSSSNSSNSSSTSSNEPSAVPPNSNPVDSYTEPLLSLMVDDVSSKVMDSNQLEDDQAILPIISPLVTSSAITSTSTLSSSDTVPIRNLQDDDKLNPAKVNTPSTMATVVTHHSAGPRILTSTSILYQPSSMPEKDGPNESDHIQHVNMSVPSLPSVLKDESLRSLSSSSDFDADRSNGAVSESDSHLSVCRKYFERLQLYRDSNGNSTLSKAVEDRENVTLSRPCSIVGQGPDPQAFACSTVAVAENVKTDDRLV